MTDADPGEDFRLCFTDLPWATFVTLDDFDDLHADDLNNGYRNGDIYEPRDDSDVQYELLRIAVRGPFQDANRELPALTINEQRMTWLVAYAFADEDVAIKAKVSATEFIRLIRKAGGEVFMPPWFAQRYAESQSTILSGGSE